ncbi:MAG TPA: hypothetical protein VN654_29405 [Vicinamibacterales bacterium]|nr:hypothetical protein [Vicinamibacterales bacterium]
MFPVTPFVRRLLATVLMLVCGAVSVTAGGPAAGDFTKRWNGRRVVVKSTLYTVLYDEVGRVGIHYRGKQAGLTIATPEGQYYEFAAPGPEDEDVVEQTPNEVVDEMSTRFVRAYHLDIGIVKTITPLSLRQFEPGVVLIVDSIKVDRTRIRFAFRRAGEATAAGEAFATSLTVEWPVPLSKTLHERDGIEGVLQRFIEPL